MVKNQSAISGVDAAGNVYLPASGGYPADLAYDGENRMVSGKTSASGTMSAEYDGEGHRVKRTVNNVTTVYVYDAMGGLAQEYGGGSNTSGRQYLVPDHLGSTRLMLSNGGTVQSRTDYYPFGQEIEADSTYRTAGLGYQSKPAADADWQRVRFTGKQRDAETGLDYFETRYLSSAQGRFTSPDPLLSSGRPDQPQSWNRYSYVLNNPLKFTDPTGQQEQGPCGPQQDDCIEVLQGTAIAGKQGAENFVLNLVNTPIVAVNFLAEPVGGYVAPLPLPEKTSGDEGVDAGSKIAEFTIGIATMMFSGGTSGGGTATQSSTPVFQRVMSTGELEATESTGLLRGGRTGTNYFTDSASLDAKRAQIRLGLDGPLRDHRVSFTINGDVPVSGPFRAQPGISGTPGGGRSSGHCNGQASRSFVSTGCENERNFNGCYSRFSGCSRSMLEDNHLCGGQGYISTGHCLGSLVAKLSARF